MPGFDKEPNGNYFNEYYGEVPMIVMEAINEFHWSPADFNRAIELYGSADGLAEVLKKNGFTPNAWDIDKDFGK
jgi:hypothetical protein